MRFPPFTISEHTADVCVNAYGTTRAELFSNAAASLWYYLEPVYADRDNHHTLMLSEEAPNVTYLLIAFLSEVLTYADINTAAYPDVTFNTITDTHVTAYAQGYPVTHFAGCEIKAVTYHRAHVVYTDGIWRATFIYDI